MAAEAQGPNLKKEEYRLHAHWILKSRVNYFSCFMELWVGFNAWFKNICGETKDRACLEALKQGHGECLRLFEAFDYFLHEISIKDALVFKSNLEALHYTLSGNIIKYPEGPKSKFQEDKVELRSVSFNTALPDWSKRKRDNGYYDLIFGHKPETDEEVWEEKKKIAENPEYKSEFTELDRIRLVNDPKLVYAGLLEIIYQIRCKLFHGDLDPNNPDHYDMVKYSYELLFAMASYIR